MECGEGLRLVGGVEVGNIFKLGTRYSEAMGCTFLDKDGTSKPVVMGSYGIGVGRLLACVAEEYNDERGLRWPMTVAPFEVEVVSLGKAGELSEVQETADRLYEMLELAGLEVLYDDREATPGVKFADADLIGIPLRVTVSARSLERGGVEVEAAGRYRDGHCACGGCGRARAGGDRRDVQGDWGEEVDRGAGVLGEVKCWLLACPGDTTDRRSARLQGPPLSSLLGAGLHATCLQEGPGCRAQAQLQEQLRRLSEVMVATTHMGKFKTSSAKCLYNIFATNPWQASHATATSIRTSSASVSDEGTAIPSLAAASK